MAKSLFSIVRECRWPWEARRRKKWIIVGIVLIFIQVYFVLHSDEEKNEIDTIRVGEYIILHSQKDGNLIGTNEYLDSSETVEFQSLAKDGQAFDQHDETYQDDPDVGRGFQEEFVTYRKEKWPETIPEDIGDEDNVYIKESNAEPLHETDPEYLQQYNPEYLQEMKHELETGSKPETSPDSNQEHLQHLHPALSTVNVTKPVPRVPNQKSIDQRGYFKQYAKPDKISPIGNYKFQNYNVLFPDMFQLTYDEGNYFHKFSENVTCFIAGTNLAKTQKYEGRRCYCRPGYYGFDCGIPAAAWYGGMQLYPSILKRRERPRRVINGFPVNHEFAMFEARMNELYNVVDVFLIGESNYTAHADAKELEFLNRLKEGYMKDFQDKLVYILQGHFPIQGTNDGWLADHYIRFFLGRTGIPILKGLERDDLFVLSDADELPTKEVITFLKLYDGYPEPVAFGLRWTVFGFFWKYPPDDHFWNQLIGAQEKLTTVFSVATIGMLEDVLMNNTFFIRKQDAWKNDGFKNGLLLYRSKGHEVINWVLGTPGNYAGWHCSWCFSPKNIVKKMDSAQEQDKPRWGDYPDKKNLTYISSRITQGIWFDDELKFLRVDPSEVMYAPSYFIQNAAAFRSLLYHPDHPLNEGKNMEEF